MRVLIPYGFLFFGENQRCDDLPRVRTVRLEQDAEGLQ